MLYNIVSKAFQGFLSLTFSLSLFMCNLSLFMSDRSGKPDAASFKPYLLQFTFSDDSGAGAFAAFSVWLSLRYFLLIPAAMNEAKEYKLALLWHWLPIVTYYVHFLFLSYMSSDHLLINVLHLYILNSVSLQCSFGGFVKKKLARHRYQ